MTVMPICSAPDDSLIPPTKRVKFVPLVDIAACQSDIERTSSRAACALNAHNFAHRCGLMATERANFLLRNAQFLFGGKRETRQIGAALQVTWMDLCFVKLGTIKGRGSIDILQLLTQPLHLQPFQIRRRDRLHFGVPVRTIHRHSKLLVL